MVQSPSQCHCYPGRLIRPRSTQRSRAAHAHPARVAPGLGKHRTRTRGKSPCGPGSQTPEVRRPDPPTALLAQPHTARPGDTQRRTRTRAIGHARHRHCVSAPAAAGTAGAWGLCGARRTTCPTAPGTHNRSAARHRPDRRHRTGSCAVGLAGHRTARSSDPTRNDRSGTQLTAPTATTDTGRTVLRASQSSQPRHQVRRARD